MINVEEFDSFEKVKNLKQTWDELVAEKDPSLTFDWMESYWKSRLNKLKVIILVLKENNNIIAIFPLCKIQEKIHGLKVNAITQINIYHDHNDFIIKEKREECLKLMFEYLNKNYPNWNLFKITLVKNNKNCDILKKNKLVLIKNISKGINENVAPYLPLKGTFDEYVLSLSRMFRQNLRRYERRLKKEGNIEFEIIYGHENLEKILKEIYEIEKNSWKENTQTSITANEEQQRFYEAYLAKAADQDKLRIMFLRLNGEAIAYQICIIHNNKLLMQKTSFKDKYKKLSPGIQLCRKAIKFAYEQDFKEYDFLKGDESYKLKFTNNIREYLNFFIYNNNLKSIILYSISKLKSIIKSY